MWLGDALKSAPAEQCAAADRREDASPAERRRWAEIMNTDGFATITQNVIAANGFEDFQPMACFPKRHAVRCLAGFPSGEDPELPPLEWATGVAIREKSF
jgi:hypothetical protein